MEIIDRLFAAPRSGRPSFDLRTQQAGWLLSSLFIFTLEAERASIRPPCTLAILKKAKHGHPDRTTPNFGTIGTIGTIGHRRLTVHWADGPVYLGYGKGEGDSGERERCGAGTEVSQGNPIRRTKAAYLVSSRKPSKSGSSFSSSSLGERSM